MKTQVTNTGQSADQGGCPAVLLMLVGIPGSGKSTWAQDYLNHRPDYKLVSTDQIRAQLYGDEAVQGDWRQVWRRVLYQWQLGLDDIGQGGKTGIIYDATNARRRHRRQAIAMARAMGFRMITLVWFDVPLEVCLSRNFQRSRQVPAEVIVKMHRQLQSAPPSLGEDVDALLRITAPDPG